MDMIFRHFNQFHTLEQALDKSLLLFDQEEEETYYHMRHLKHKFSMIIDATSFTDDLTTLMELINLFTSPNTQNEEPAITELCYSNFWGAKCLVCGKWWRDRKSVNAKQKANEAKEISLELAKKCEESHKHAQSALSQGRAKKV